MTTPFKVPELGESVKTAIVARLLVSPGDRVARDQAVVELETDKAVAEVPSDVEGTVAEVLVKTGDEVHVGQALFTVSAEAPGTAGPEPVRPPQESPAPKAPAPVAGPAGLSGPAAAGNPRPAGPKPAPRAGDKPAAEAPAPVAPGPKTPEPIPAAPSVRRLARELGVDLGAVPGSGPAGRIRAEDVRARARPQGAQEPAAEAAPAAFADDELPDFSAWGAVEREPMSPVRRLTAERLARAWRLIPHVTQFGRADVTEIEALRRRYQDDAERAGGHLTLTVILLKTVAGALKAFPRFNASVDMARRELVRKSYCNVGVAVDTDRGLVVPVVRGVDRKNLIELSVELRRLTARARDGKLDVADLRGGCFTISNAGALGGDFFTPIIPWPEVAILGLGRARVEAVHREGAFRPRLMLPLSLSHDHRVIDGADGVRFLRWIIEALEEPVKLLWEG